MFFIKHRVSSKYITLEKTQIFQEKRILFFFFIEEIFWNLLVPDTSFSSPDFQAFSKKQIDDRKEWLTHFMEDRRQRKLLGLPEVKISNVSHKMCYFINIGFMLQQIKLSSYFSKKFNVINNFGAGDIVQGQSIQLACTSSLGLIPNITQKKTPTVTHYIIVLSSCSITYAILFL